MNDILSLEKSVSLQRTDFYTNCEYKGGVKNRFYRINNTRTEANEDGI